MEPRGSSSCPQQPTARAYPELHYSTRHIVQLLKYLLQSHLAQLLEALRYKPEGRGSIPDGAIGIFH